MNDLDPNMKKVFKQESQLLNKHQAIAKDLNLAEDALRSHYQELLQAYRLLLQDAMKITSIGDINQKKLFDAFEELEKQKAILYQSSIMDHLTQVYNRMYIMQVFEDAFAQYKRYQQIFSCILLDIDDFKAINDTYGHQMGDEVLKVTARQIASQLRETDSFGRYGGEEFLIILPNNSAREAQQVAEKIRTSVAQSTVGIQNLSVTISLGVCDTQMDSPTSQDELLHNVDIALYEAKENGKNRTVIYQKE